VAAKLGISDLLADGPRAATELAQLTKAHAPSLDRVLRLLAALMSSANSRPDILR
jgi:hypothetical protein